MTARKVKSGAVASKVFKPWESFSSSAWLDALMVSVKLVRDSSDIIPFPYIGLTAGVALRVLELIQVSDSKCLFEIDFKLRLCSPSRGIEKILRSWPRMLLR